MIRAADRLPLAIILGTGAGQCGLPLLAEILNKQPGTCVSQAQLPWLPWNKRPDAPGIHERLRRIIGTARHGRIGDVASFYLPYVDEAIQHDRNIRIVCLKRPRDEVIEGFCRTLDGSSTFRVNHWAKAPATGWSHDLFTTRIYPQYDTSNRQEGIGLYWDEYYARAEQLQGRYPKNFRIWDSDVLTTAAGVRDVLTFAGIPATEQMVVVGKRPLDASKPSIATTDSSTCTASGQPAPKKCAVLVPAYGPIHPECEKSLKVLERRGYPVRRVPGYAAIDQARNQMATDALREGFEETLWIDSDIGFDPDSVELFRSHKLPIVCGIYPKKGQQALACHVLPGTKSITFGEDGGLTEILYAGTGFLLVRREAYLAVQRHWNLPVCNERFARPLIPFFQPLTRAIDDGYWALAEDYSFCHRAREAGIQIIADTTVRLWHIGESHFGWEDAAGQTQRQISFTLNLEQSADSTSSSFSPLPRKERADVAVRLADVV